VSAKGAEEVVVESLAGGRASGLAVRVKPGARRSGVTGTWNGRLALAVQSPPEDGRANEELLRLVAALFGLRRSAVELAAGAGARQKKLRLALAPADCRRRVAELLEEAR